MATRPRSRRGHEFDHLLWLYPGVDTEPLEVWWPWGDEVCPRELTWRGKTYVRTGATVGAWVFHAEDCPLAARAREAYIGGGRHAGRRCKSCDVFWSGDNVCWSCGEVPSG